MTMKVSWAEEITPENLESTLTDNQESYANYAKQTGTDFHKCAASPAATPPSEQSSYLRIQSDQGANANITDNLDALLTSSGLHQLMFNPQTKRALLLFPQ